MIDACNKSTRYDTPTRVATRGQRAPGIGAEYGAPTVLWIAVLLSIVVWLLGLSSGFLGPLIHVFLLIALLAALARALPSRSTHLDDDANAADAAPPPE